MAVVTISRQVGSGGSEIARILSGRLGFRLLDRAGLEALLPSYGLDEHNLLDLDGLPDNPAAWDKSDLAAWDKSWTCSEGFTCSV